MYSQLADINSKPAPFSIYTARDLWTDPHRAQQMLSFHLNETLDISSRNHSFIDTSARWIAEHFALGPATTVCDLGCGPGLYASRFAQSGANVTGVDFSANSIAYARRTAPKDTPPVTYIHADYLAFHAPLSFDLITMIMCDFCALGPDLRRNLLGRIYDNLKPGGALLLDVYALPALAAREDTAIYEKNQLNHFWYAQDYYAFVNTFTYKTEAVSLDKYTLFPDKGPPETVYNWLQYFSPDTLTAELTAAGFVPDATYRDVGGTPYDDTHSEFAQIGRKPA